MKKKTKATQVWHKDGECPEKTIPIRRTKKEDILRAKSLERFGKKNHQYSPEDTSSSPNYHHEVCVALFQILFSRLVILKGGREIVYMS